MNTIFRSAISLAGRYFATLIMLVAILLLCKFVYREWEQWQQLESALGELRQQQREVDAHLVTLTNRLTIEAATWGKLPLAVLDAQIAATDQRVAALSKDLKVPTLSLQVLRDAAVPQEIGGYFKHKAEIELLRQKRHHLQLLSTFLARDAARALLDQRRRDHVDVYAALQLNLQRQRGLQSAHAFLIWVPQSAPHKQWQALSTEEAQLRQSNTRAHTAYQEQKARVDNLPVAAIPGPFRVNSEQLHMVIEPLRQLIGEVSSWLSTNKLRQASALVIEEVRLAVVILLSACLMPVGIKAVFYYVFAPLAARRPPLHLDRPVSGNMLLPKTADTFVATPTTISSISHAITLGKDEQLLIHPGYLQSASISSRKRTRWLLDWSCPLTSIAAGLVALTCIHAEQPESVVISATDDPLDEVALLLLPAGAALVLQPRNLVGVLSHRATPLVIERHWRLGSLHAWLTLQLRYLVFRGPVTLIVKGCRGVKVEPAGTGHRISQSATLGFSADVGYSTRRNDTFFPYLIGKQSLFLDQFDGPSGYYVYEEVPRAGRKTGLWGRGCEGAADAVLKAFGI